MGKGKTFTKQFKEDAVKYCCHCNNTEQKAYCKFLKDSERKPFRTKRLADPANKRIPLIKHFLIPFQKNAKSYHFFHIMKNK